MKKIKSKLIALIVITIFSFVGCSNVSSNEGGSPSGSNNKIPENGAVTAETFEKIKDSGKMALLQGENKTFSLLIN